MNELHAQDVVAFIPLRAGSKGLANKNIRIFGDRPLYEHAIAQGLRCCGACVVSTDIDQVLNRPKQENVRLHSRPEEFARDTSSMDEVLADAIDAMGLHGTTIVLLQATSPLRPDATIIEATRRHAAEENDLVMSVTPANKSTLKWGFLNDGRFAPLSKPVYCFMNRQTLPEVYRPTGAVYVFSADWFMQRRSLTTDKIGAVVMPPEQSLDIDTAEDFDRAENFFLKHGGNL